MRNNPTTSKRIKVPYEPYAMDRKEKDHYNKWMKKMNKKLYKKGIILEG